jgi:hypothetical protein
MNIINADQIVCGYWHGVQLPSEHWIQTCKYLTEGNGVYQHEKNVATLKSVI